MKTKHTDVCMDVNRRLKNTVVNNVPSSCLDVKEFINKVDPVVWETINILTNSRCDTSKTYVLHAWTIEHQAQSNL